MALDAATTAIAAEDIAGSTTAIEAHLTLSMGTNDNRTDAAEASTTTRIAASASAHSIGELHRSPAALRLSAARIGQDEGES
ncbi:hypothetical protein AWZ03_015072, partial [Drosophila navojoa]